MSDVPVHPIQTKPEYGRRPALMPQTVTLRAYEVYSHVYGEQKALITGGCRGGFDIGELVAFLYAYPFPKSEWPDRVQEAFRGMRI